MSSKSQYEYDFAISFADENREIARTLSEALRKEGARIFYDDDFKPDLLGKNLRKEFKKIYSKKTQYLVVIISRYYPLKDWSQFEFEVGKKEAKKRKVEFILPIRLDSTMIVGLPSTLAYLDLRKNGNIEQAARILISKLRNSPESAHKISDSITRDHIRRREYIMELITSENIPKFNEFRKLENYARLDLRQINLGGYWNFYGKKRTLNLKEIILKGSIFDQSNLSMISVNNSDSSSSSFYLANLSDTSFLNVDLSQGFFQQVDFYDSTVKDCNLFHAGFMIANLFETYFSRCYIYKSNFSYAKCNNSRFIECAIFNANFHNANALDASFHSSVLIDCQRFDGLICRNANFANTIINNEDFVKYLRQNGAKNVPDAVTKSNNIKDSLANLGFTQTFIDKMCRNLK
jgi:uncharacterized protein YjbI with pentapeptide repeats